MSIDVRRSDWRETPLTRMLGLRIPLVLGPFGGLSSVELAAAVSNAGGLGSYGLYGMAPERILDTAAQLRRATDRPFNLNLWLDRDGTHSMSPTASEFAEWLKPLERYFTELGVELPTLPGRFLPSVEEQFDAVLEARPDAASFVFGVPSADMLERCRDAGIRTLGSATTVDEAVALDRAGVDAIVATGFEAGGHRVSFLRPAEESLMGLVALLPRVVDAVAAPVIAAGGIADGRGIAAALALGADGVLLGTAFLATNESAASDPHRRRILGDDGTQTELTRVFSGRLARGIPNRMLRELSHVPEPLAPFPAQGWLVGRLKDAARAAGNGDLISLWAGQAAPLARGGSASDLVAALEAETDAVLARGVSQ
jgi:nitronate monooxygenase